MNKLSVVVLSALCIAAAASAQTSDRQGVTVDTDPARAAAVERHAQELHHGMHASMARGHRHDARHTTHKSHKARHKAMKKSPA